MRSPPGGKRSRRKKEEDGGKSIPEAHLKPEWKARDFLIYMGKKSDLKDLKNTEIQLVFLRPLFFCRHIGWRTQGLLPKSPSQHPPPPPSLVSPVALGCQKMELMDKHQRPIFTRGAAAAYLVFFISLSFYFPQACILYTCLRLCLVDLWFIFYFYSPPPPLVHYEPASLMFHTHTHTYEKFKNSCMFAFPYLSLVVFFSNHKVTVYTCIVWLYWNLRRHR